MSRKIHIAAIAIAVVDGMPVENYARTLRLAQIAGESRPDIILLPEAFAAGYVSTNLAPYAEPIDSPSLTAFNDLSKEADCMVVLGCLLPGNATRVRNSAVIFDRGQLIGVHTKSTLWPDDGRPYRDERALLLPGDGVEVFQTRFGRIAVLICYENMVIGNWSKIPPDVDFILSPYNCEGDPGIHNVKGSALIGRPSAWANRTGTVFAGTCWNPNPGSAGAVDALGEPIKRSPPGVEEIVYVTVSIEA